MDALVSYPRSLLGFPCSFSKSKLQSFESWLNMTEITDGSSVFVRQRNFQELSIARVQRRGILFKDESKKKLIPHSFDGEESSSSKQEEMIALFRRIKTSISNDNSASSNINTSMLYGESVNDVLQSRKQMGEKTSKKEGDKLFKQRSGDEKIYDDYPTVTDPMLTRPPTSFMKRSPIRSPASVSVKLEPENGEVSTSKIGEMKVGELKELAKSRGLKGYSKLKKSELLDLLGSS